MYKFFLDKTEVAEPESFSNISFEKKRDENYFGFILRRKGIVKVVGAGQIKFTEPKAISILKAAKDKDGYGAITTITVYEDDILAYQGTINYWNAEWRSESVVVTFSDDSPVVKFLANAATKYEIATNKIQTIGSTGIIGKTTHKITDTLYVFKQKTPSAQSFTHVIPFQNISGSSNANVNEITNFADLLPIYTNDSEKKTVSIKASIFVNARAEANVTVNVNGLITNTYILSETASDLVFIIDEEIILAPYETVSVQVVSVDNSADILFTYDVEKSVLSLNEIKDVIDTDVPCISSFDLLSELVSKTTDAELSLQSSFLSALSQDWTNGKNLRGVVSNINASFDDVFFDLNKQYCLTSTVTESKVIIEQRKDVVKSGSKSYLDRDRIVEEVKLPNRDFLYSKIIAGYKDWAGDSALSGQEVNAQSEWKTNLYGRENTLNLVCGCVASGILIEEIRQMQFGKISNEQQKKHDETLICLIPNDGFENYDTSDINEDSRNLSVRPRKMLENWANVYGDYKFWDFVSGVGNNTATIEGIEQSKGIELFGSIISDSVWELVYNCELWEYTNIGDVIYWTDTLGDSRKGVLMQAEWRSDKQMLMTIIETK